MSLTNIVKGVMDKPSVLDRKQLAYFFKKEHSRGFDFLFAMRMLKPKTVSVIIKSEEDKTEVEEIDNLKAVLEALSLDVKITAKCRWELERDLLTDENQLAMIKEFYDADLIIDNNHTLTGGLKNIIKPVQFNHHGFGIPHVIGKYGCSSRRNVETFGQIPLEELFPVANMFLMEDIIKTRPITNKRILITCFNDRDKKDSSKQLSELLNAFPKFNKYLQIDIRFIFEEYQKEQHWQETINGFDNKPYEFILAISKEIEVYSQDKDGVVSEKLGWLLI